MNFGDSQLLQEANICRSLNHRARKFPTNTQNASGGVDTNVSECSTTDSSLESTKPLLNARNIEEWKIEVQRIVEETMAPIQLLSDQRRDYLHASSSDSSVDDHLTSTQLLPRSESPRRLLRLSDERRRRKGVVNELHSEASEARTSMNLINKRLRERICVELRASITKVSEEIEKINSDIERYESAFRGKVQN